MPFGIRQHGTVINVDQIESLLAHYYAIASGEPNPDERDERAEAFLCAYLGLELEDSDLKAA